MYFEWRRLAKIFPQPWKFRSWQRLKRENKLPFFWRHPVFQQKPNAQNIYCVIADTLSLYLMNKNVHENNEKSFKK